MKHFVEVSTERGSKAYVDPLSVECIEPHMHRCKLTLSSCVVIHVNEDYEKLAQRIDSMLEDLIRSA